MAVTENMTEQTHTVTHHEKNFTTPTITFCCYLYQKNSQFLDITARCVGAPYCWQMSAVCW